MDAHAAKPSRPATMPQKRAIQSGVVLESVVNGNKMAIISGNVSPNNSKKVIHMKRSMNTMLGPRMSTSLTCRSRYRRARCHHMGPDYEPHNSEITNNNDHGMGQDQR